MRKLILQPASTGNALTHYANTIEKTKHLSEIRPYVREGTFDQLMADGGEFYRLYQSEALAESA